MSLVSRRFHKLITTPHAWRIAFARYFPGAESVELLAATPKGSTVDVQISERRTFSRLSALASWRSEYILRTRLLRSLGRGRPAIQAATKSSGTRGSASSNAAVVTYSSGLLYPVSHIHATFGVGLNKKQPLFMHGAVEQGAVSTSDPSVAKIGNWGLGDFEAFKHFADLFVGEAEYGLGAGNTVGMPNVMDVSQPYGKLYGEACPGGRVFYTSANEQRGRFLPISSAPQNELGIPEVTMIGCAVCSVWIAKSEPVLKATNGIVGSLAGFSNGVLAAYALGVNPVHDRRYDKGEPTAKWVICPGVPIIAISVDENVSSRRLGLRRIWAAALNALGEVFYLTGVPLRPDFKGKPTPEDIDRLAWQTGRTVEWTLIESTRRSAKPDPFNTASVDGSYSPRTSSDACGLSKAQIVAETKEVEKYLRYKPKDFQALCDGWDMRRKLVVDFAGDDGHGAGEAFIILRCGLDTGENANIMRITRQKTKVSIDHDLEPYPAIVPQSQQKPSIFGGSSLPKEFAVSSESPRSAPRSRTSSHDDLDVNYKVEWRTSNLAFGDHRNVQICTVASDNSEFATLCAQEDPLLGMSGGSNASSPMASPMGQLAMPSSPSEIPGHRGRFLAIGTNTGIVMLWDMRASTSATTDVINTVQPLRVIYTKSPQISSLALTSLYVVHGGNDGLVQAWDLLASSFEPIRTLNSRFSDRARRRIAQAEASVQGVGNNYYAAGAIALDPDPTVLRGMVSLGTLLRYWSYSSNAADAYKSKKRGQLSRKSDRGANLAASAKVTATGRGVLRDYIANETTEMEHEKITRRKEEERLSGRFGMNLLGADASEEEMLAYATMLSEEAWTSDETKRAHQDYESPYASRSTATPQHSKPAQNDVDAELAEAIRLSLLESEQASPSPATDDFNIPIRYAKSSKYGTPSKTGRAGSSKAIASDTGDDDLDFALQLSLAEQQSRMMDEQEFPTLAKSPSPTGSQGSGKGKGKSRRG